MWIVDSLDLTCWKTSSTCVTANHFLCHDSGPGRRIVSVPVHVTVVTCSLTHPWPQFARCYLHWSESNASLHTAVSVTCRGTSQQRPACCRRRDWRSCGGWRLIKELTLSLPSMSAALDLSSAVGGQVTWEQGTSGCGREPAGCHSQHFRSSFSFLSSLSLSC